MASRPLSDLPRCLLPTALLSAIDPVATLGVFGKLGVERRLERTGDTCEKWASAFYKARGSLKVGGLPRGGGVGNHENS